MDLALCYNSDCPLSLTCLRFTAQPSEWQGYHHFELRDGKCEFFRPNGEKYDSSLGTSSTVPCDAVRSSKPNPLSNEIDN
jgi:hypothetical protein